MSLILISINLYTFNSFQHLETGSEYDYFLIGLSLTMFKGKYVWTTSGEVLSYSNWLPGQPNAPNIERCVAASTSGKWHDVRCNIELYFICEKENVIL